MVVPRRDTGEEVQPEVRQRRRPGFLRRITGRALRSVARAADRRRTGARRRR